MADISGARARVAQTMKSDRLRRGWSKQQAADAAGITIVTYRQAEAGRSVRDTTYAAIERVFGRLPGTYQAIADGDEPAAAAAKADSVPATVTEGDDVRGFVLDVDDPREVRIFAITDLPESERIWHILQMRRRDRERRDSEDPGQTRGAADAG
ncbi:helix-turn-helix transcriptional regulator [Streptomyces sp. YIM 98790]|uniref:helix-turn-helix domain-containing protein n=1 Tax=Streptomyces sp. YIM 98790 TaxID=2689077 RepID=UPI00140BB0EF|nr:helix-turn-helix transcriptional regulator [Streptomyces sp. YIM 98790]